MTNLIAFPVARRRSTNVLTTAEQVRAVFSHRALYEVAAVVPEKDRVGRPRLFPTYLLLGYGVLARVYRSGARAGQELTDPAVWRVIGETVDVAIEEFGLDVPAPGARPPDWPAFRYARDKYLTDPLIQDAMLEVFTELAVVQARSLGLLDPAGPGSLCHPHPRTRRALTRTADDMTRLLQTGSTKRSPKQKALAIFDYPGILTLAGCYEEYRATRMDPRGRKPRFPSAVLLATATLARALGSLPEAIKVLRDEDVWGRVQEIWETYEGAAPLPPYPPARDQVQEIRKTIEDRDGLLAELKETFTAMAVRQAQAQGNLRPGTDADSTSIDPRHTLFGDGVILKPMTDVIAVWNPVKERTEYIGSRAQFAPPRVQKAVRALTTDHPGQHGINFVTIHTETCAGLVTLGVEATLGGEQWAALEVLHRINAHARGLAHTVVYDGALAGWVIDHLMGALGMDLVQKGRKRPPRGRGHDDRSEETSDPSRNSGRRERPHDTVELDVHASTGVLTADFLNTYRRAEPKTRPKPRNRDGIELTGPGPPERHNPAQAHPSIPTSRTQQKEVIRHLRPIPPGPYRPSSTLPN